MVALLPVGPNDRIFSWLAEHPEGARWDALLTWIVAAAIDPEAVTSKTFLNSDRHDRVVYVSYVPIAETAAVFMVFTSPVRAIHIIRFDDDDYAVFKPEP